MLAIVAAQSKLTKKELARRARYTRDAYYKHVKMPNLEDHILMAYGRVLKYDFRIHFPKMANYMDNDANTPSSETEHEYIINPTLEAAIRQLRKSVDQVEKDTKAIEEMIEKKRGKK